MKVSRTFVRSFFCSLIAFSYLSAIPAGRAETPAEPVSSKKTTEEKPEFNITCTDRGYLAVIERAILALEETRADIRTSYKYIDQMEKEGRDPGPGDLPGPLPRKWVPPKTKNYQVYWSKARRLLMYHRDYYRELEEKTLLRKLNLLKLGEQLIVDMILEAEKQCREIMGLRAEAKERGEGTAHALAGVSPRSSH